MTSIRPGRVTYKQAAEILGCHHSNVAKLVAKGYLLSERRRDGALFEADVVRLAQWRAEEAASPAPRPPKPRAIGAPPRDGHQWVTPAAAGRHLGITGQAVAQRLRKGTMPGVRRGNRWWIRSDHLDVLALVEQARCTRLAG